MTERRENYGEKIEDEEDNHIQYMILISKRKT